MRISDWSSDVCSSDLTAHKLGLAECRDGDVELIGDLYALMQAAEIDMTLLFRALPGVDVQAPSLAPMSDAFYDPAKQRAPEAPLLAWLARSAARLRDDPPTPDARSTRTLAPHPRYLLPHYLPPPVITHTEPVPPPRLGRPLPTE